MPHDNLDPELSAALARLESSFQALGDTRDTVGRTLDNALDSLTRQINALDLKLRTQADNMNDAATEERDAA